MDDAEYKALYVGGLTRTEIGAIERVRSANFVGPLVAKPAKHVASMTAESFWNTVYERFVRKMESALSEALYGKPDPLHSVSNYTPLHPCPIGYAEHLVEVK